MEKNINLRPYNTFGIPGKATGYAEFADVDKLRALLAECRAEGLEWRVLGAGSNVLFTGDFGGVILRSSARGIGREGELVIAEAGVVWDDMVRWSVENNMGGVENLAHIPGTVGAAPIQNIGAYGAEAGDTIEWVEFLDIDTDKIKRMDAEQCEFGYRDSIFKRNLFQRAIVLRVAFRLTPHPTRFNIDYGDVAALVGELGGPSLPNIYAAITQIRKSKLPEPSEMGNAGSFFKNPVISASTFENLRKRYPEIRFFDLADGSKKIPAAWLIEQAGWKGRSLGPAGVHARQPLVLVNLGGATGADILALAAAVISDVADKFGITLEMEVNRIEG